MIAHEPEHARTKIKVLTFVGTRPEIIRLSRVTALLDQHCTHVIVHTGQNYDYELNAIFYQDLGLRTPDQFLNAAGDTSAATIGNTITLADKVLREEKPDALLVLGDTNSCLAAIAAKRLKIPVFHMEAGNRCYDLRVPEEINRKIIDHVSDINLTYSHIARENLLRENLPPDMVFVTGSPMMEVLDHYKPQIESSNILERLELDRERYFVASLHREENVDRPENLEKIAEILNALVAEYGFPVIFSAHPRTRKRIEEIGLEFDPQVRIAKPFAFTDYIALQKNAFATLSDSGTITEEASLCDFPAVNLRETHERQEGMEEGAVMMVGLNPDRVRQALRLLAAEKSENVGRLRIPADYDAPDVSRKVLRLILSYTDYVKNVVWREN